jgi:hypothetical protein
MNWIDLAQDKERWTTVLNTVMNLLVPRSVKELFSGYATGSLVQWLEFLATDPEV